MRAQFYLYSIVLSSLVTLVSFQYSYGQQADSLKAVKNGLHKPNLTSTHHLGLFSARISSNFKTRAASQWTVNLETQSGNTFHAPVQAFLPDDPAIRERFRDQIWYFRTFDFIDQETTPAQILSMEIDAVYKVYRPSIVLPLTKHSDITIGLRAFATVKGNFLNAPFTNDETIEWFHSNIAGGEDPFGRKVYGLNEVNINYTDRNGRQLTMDAGDLIIGGLELSHTYYLPLEKVNTRRFYINLQSQLGWNTSKYNESLDLGLSLNLIKEWQLNEKSDLSAALAYNVLHRNTIDLDDDNLDLGNNSFLGTGELMLQWSHKTIKSNYNLIGIHYQLQTSYFNKDEEDFFHLKGDFAAVNQGWHYGYTTLVENLSSWSFLYSHVRPRITYNIYVKEDLQVNNAPDVETGLSIQFSL